MLLTTLSMMAQMGGRFSETLSEEEKKRKTKSEKRKKNNKGERGKGKLNEMLKSGAVSLLLKPFQ